jgi:hypothetical protein
MVMMIFDHVVVVDKQVFDHVHSQLFDFVDDHPNKINVVLPIVTYVDKMYLEVIHLLVDDHVENTIITNELNDTIKMKKLISRIIEVLLFTINC